MKMSQPLRIDYPEGHSSFVTRRFRNSQLLYCNNQDLEARVLGSLGKYLTKYDAKIFAFTIFGSHDHPMLQFKPKTKSAFFRDFGARTAEAIKKYVPSFGTGAVFERRPSEQAITEDQESHLDRLMYTILQPIQAGLCRNLSDYPGFNSYHYIITGKPLEVEFFNGAEYNKARRRNKNADPADFIEHYKIVFEKIPGCENMTQKQYSKLIQEEYNKRRETIIKDFDDNGHIWPSPESLKRTKSTDCAKSPKRSTRESKRPLVLSLCMERRVAFLNYYFSILVAFKKASVEYLLGNRNAQFPEGTCIPPGPWC
jgi:hypothetical protein